MTNSCTTNPEETIFIMRKPTGGTDLTVILAQEYNKPYLIIDFSKTSENAAAALIREWIHNIKPSTLNVAGSRASKLPEIYNHVFNTLASVYKEG